MTPAGYTFSIWGVIYAWQALWILYAWTYTFRPNAIRTIFTGVYIGYSIVNSFNITWIYVWGNEHVVASSVILFLFNAAFYPTIALLFGYFNTVKDKAGKVDIVLTYALPMNGLCLYATWTTIAMLINLTAAVQYTTSISGTNMATISLTILLLLVLTYFILENTILDKYGFRYVYSVYPVVVWALAGVLAAHWGKGDGNSSLRNGVYKLVLLLVAGGMLVVKFGLLGVYLKYRKPSQKKVTLVPSST